MKQSMTLTSLLNITHSIIQAGMAGATIPELVATISNDGGLGTIGAGYMSLAQLNDEIDKAPAVHKEAITTSTETDTTLTKAISGKEARGIKNQLIVNLEQYYEDILPYPYQNDLTSPFRKLAAQNNNVVDLHLWCGQTPRLAKVNYAKDIFRSLI
ncbi:nitronate monooxygenase [Macrococcus armenti]|uniref:Nitronate monooxygenase n=1 Tax=Macrococcus armenti TaxID=2875764 RepID=A0ABY3ZVA1_9STAP|nr:nitronate monooxygenase [Macrococcus armenti]UOB20826.1 nitronate monooxygenase [Macrococcus armenti]